MTNDPFAYTRGPRSAPILLVGEAWGSEEAQAQLPFIGQSGRELSRMLHEAGILETDILFTNVVDARPAANDFTAFLVPTKDKKLGTERNGLYCKKPLLDGLTKLDTLIAAVQPKLVIGCGNIPLWALTNRATVGNVGGYKVPSGIMNYRGSQLYHNDIPFLPIIHPAAILRSYDLRARTVHDLKARAGRFMRKEMDWKEPLTYSFPTPTYSEAKAMLEDWLNLASSQTLWLSVDIETYRANTIACVGIADHSKALCLPLFYFNPAGEVVHYFHADQEIKLMLLLRELLMEPNTKIIGQNYNYDYQYLDRFYNITKPVAHDTMIAHHLFLPGTPKGLDYLSSMYCNHHVYWKDESQEWADGVSHEDLWRYNCKDTAKTYEIAMEQQKFLASEPWATLYAGQLEQWQLASAMARRGVRIDRAQLSTISADLLAAATELENQLLYSVPADTRYAASGKPWFSSPAMVMDIMYRQLELKPVLHKKTKKPTTDAAALTVLKKRAPWLAPVFENLDMLRSINVFRSHFLEARLSYDGRMMCSFNVGGTDTFRWSSNTNSFNEGTNLQNISKGDE